MANDISDQVSAVTRAVTSKQDDDGDELRVATTTRSFATDIDDLWDAVTNPERLPRWFLPVSGELRVGGKYQIEGNASGEVLGCEPPRKLSITWEFGGQVSWLDITLRPEGSSTELVLEHAASLDAASAEFWDTYGPGAVGVGWDLALRGLALHIDGAPALDPEEGAMWPTTEEGKRFVQLASDDWGKASVTFGTDPAAATAAAAATTAFYTGEGGPEGADD